MRSAFVLLLLLGATLPTSAAIHLPGTPSEPASVAQAPPEAPSPLAGPPLADPHAALAWAARLRATPLAPAAPPESAESAALAPTGPPTLQAAYDHLSVAASAPNATLGALATLLPELQDALIPLVVAVADAAHATHTTWESLTAAHQDAFVALATAYHTNRQTHDAPGGDAARPIPDPLHAAWTRHRWALADWDQSAIVHAADRMLHAARGQATALRDAAPQWQTQDTCTTDGAGLIILCGTGNDILDGDHMLAIDLGGNDQHRDNAGGAGLDILWTGNNGLLAALSLDLDGDDTYTRPGYAQGAGASTPGVLVDLNGNDRYHASALSFTFAQGAGNLGGVGLLYDALGNDRYTTPPGRTDGRTAWDTQGFGILGGIGALIDAEGFDTYVGGTLAQGVGDFQAVGILADGTGGDTFHAVRWSQGFGDGLGTGILWNCGGQDHYIVTEEHGQGAGLGGQGLLLDLAGHDTYHAGANGQGWGKAGAAWKPINDLLVALGVPSPGAGVLFDAAGQDSYTSSGCNGCQWHGGDTGIGWDLA